LSNEFEKSTHVVPASAPGSLALAMTMLKHQKSTGGTGANSTFALICAMIALRRRANN